MEPKITTKDLIGDLENFPIEVVEKMLQNQYKQGNKMDITVFQYDKNSDKYQEGFHWSDTIEGHEFWNSVIREERFDIFFERYPKFILNPISTHNLDMSHQILKSNVLDQQMTRKLIGLLKSSNNIIFGLMIKIS